MLNQPTPGIRSRRAANEHASSENFLIMMKTPPEIYRKETIRKDITVARSKKNKEPLITLLDAHPIVIPALLPVRKDAVLEKYTNGKRSCKCHIQVNSTLLILRGHQKQPQETPSRCKEAMSLLIFVNADTPGEIRGNETSSRSMSERTP
ncbi:uncharacterized protein CC84DRAFT_269198 [Paraphaeosphaeria sporulosa]|uniref:Uncharacterized protein n=1 Tax=Paraphaeosphaeria sporulosa TaxID=1460663 RepID=A0A177C0E8_9PLEO|nr:uncharacterized protein CC84DRAFT_269198 [Paraphaeosphaeria sporulosa]OAG00886.1 hypothetical protein CC84DRAFT_269198 [Paraphaeosphaeria sporulosa]